MLAALFSLASWLSPSKAARLLVQQNICKGNELQFRLFTHEQVFRQKGDQLPRPVDVKFQSSVENTNIFYMISVDGTCRRWFACSMEPINQGDLDTRS
ncbi:uncharacterized protein [Triticum aestivum]|uniref:uncharacterized protein isoform X2 n=1 Tax=Triticum aestivum TaxID=4565 RepID=UPI001D010A76|nr:uncharacterized protein LOC123136693 isoform X2 [Triticum aestivum]XP_044412108.1 uncharacterized protein LOC123136699 isoform X2 [Triticum aestivum]